MKTCISTVALLCLVACAAPNVPLVDRNAGLDHIAISVANAEVSAAFYKGLFGFSELKTPFAGGGGVVWLDLGSGTALHIFSGRKTSVASERERHLAFTVTSMSKVTSYLRSQGLKWQDFEGVSEKIQTRPDGVQQLFFQDPDGYWVEVNDALKVTKPRASAE